MDEVNDYYETVILRMNADVKDLKMYAQGKR